jgi:amidase
MALAIRERKVSAVELLKAHLARIDDVNLSVNAIVWLDRDAALVRATQLDRLQSDGQIAGPLHGVPVTVKECFDLVGTPATMGFAQFRDNIADSNADAVARYLAAGAVIIGKTNVPPGLVDWQSYNDIYGTTNNPWDLTRTPGGSSGGSAAALASRMSALELGSDIGASIRNPAHYCGVYGLKPTWGLFSQPGMETRLPQGRANTAEGFQGCVHHRPPRMPG